MVAASDLHSLGTSGDVGREHRQGNVSVGHLGVPPQLVVAPARYVRSLLPAADADNAHASWRPQPARQVPLKCVLGTGQPGRRPSHSRGRCLRAACPTTPEAWASARGGTTPGGPAPTAELLRLKDAELWRLRQRGAAQPDHHQLAVAGLVLDGMLGLLR